MTKDIVLRSINETRRCTCCGTQKMRAPFYDWTSVITKEHVGVICQKCAIREAFGTKYKNDKKYLEWRDKYGKK